jgi:hypothetical protein
MKHLSVLRDAGLVRVREKGRTVLNSLNVIPIRLIHDRWVSGYQGLWARIGSPALAGGKWGVMRDKFLASRDRCVAAVDALPDEKMAVTMPHPFGGTCSLLDGVIKAPGQAEAERAAGRR